MVAYLKLAVRAGNADNSLIANDLRSHHGHSLTLSGVDLARHDTAPGLVLRQLQLAKTTARARAQVANVVRDLHQGARDGVQGTVRLDERIVRRECLKLRERWCEMGSGLLGTGIADFTLLGAVLNSSPVSFEISAATFTSKPFFVFRP